MSDQDAVVTQIARKPQQGGRSWTQEQKAEQAEKMRAYWATHAHPRKGMPTSEETREKMRVAQLAREPKGRCVMCEGDLFTDEVARRGVGDDCLARGVHEGYLRLEEDGTVTYLEDAG
jgi:hypothetical protein